MESFQNANDINLFLMIYPHIILHGKLQCWTKVLGQVSTFGAFTHTPDANTTSPPLNLALHLPYNAENEYLQFHLIFNIVLGVKGSSNAFLKDTATLFFALQF